jgi:hypothetical protein
MPMAGAVLELLALRPEVAEFVRLLFHRAFRLP